MMRNAMAGICCALLVIGLIGCSNPHQEAARASTEASKAEVAVWAMDRVKIIWRFTQRVRGPIGWYQAGKYGGQKTPAFSCADQPVIGANVNSTRRFCCRPASVWLSAIGRISP